MKLAFANGDPVNSGPRIPVRERSVAMPIESTVCGTAQCADWLDTASEDEAVKAGGNAFKGLFFIGPVAFVLWVLLFGMAHLWFRSLTR